MYKTNQFDFFIHSSRIWVRHSYNALNLKAELTNARGQIRKFFYDALGRITGYLAEENEVCYTYDENGNILTVSDRNGTITRTYDALNRVTSYTDTFGNVIQYRYDAVGNLEYLIYPDGSEVYYSYDVNNNLVSVTDWAGRTTTYTYDENNRVIGVTKPDGSITTTVYDNKQRIISTVEKLANGVITSGFEYKYDELGRISEETDLAKNTKLCYTYDEQSRVVKRTVICLFSSTETEESFVYDAAGNITEDNSHNFVYDVNNRLTEYNGNPVSYDLDGNMLSEGTITFSYDSGNRLTSVGGHTYTYDAENVRVRNLCEVADEDTIYTYNTNCKLSQLLCKTTNGIVTKYVYGLGLIGEEKENCFKTYHFDYRGSTIAITDANGSITDTFAYDTYGKLISRTGTSKVIFGYNGRDGVVTDKNGLFYMRARYYSPDMKRFVNADIVAGEISNAVTLNRFAYANGNPVSFVDPFGLMGHRNGPSAYEAMLMADHIYDATERDKKRPLGEQFGGWILVDIHADGGLKMGLYVKEANGVKLYAIANAGSSVSFDNIEQSKDAISDWINNFTQVFGNSEDMKKSIEKAKEWAAQLEGEKLTFVGHSKGGAEAIANAIATNHDAMVFNPATPRFTKYGLTLNGYNGTITNYIVKGEILNETLMFLNDNVASLRDEIAFLSKFNVPYYNEEYHALLNVADYIAEACLLAPIGKVVPLTYNGDATSSEKHGRQILLEILEEMYT